MAGTYIVGGLTVSGFVADISTFQPTMITVAMQGTYGIQDYVFNWSGLDVANNPGEVVSASGTGSWSLQVSLTTTVNDGGGEILYSGGTVLATDVTAGGTVNYTATGGDAASLTAFIQSLHVEIPNFPSGFENYTIGFSLTQGVNNGTWTTSFSGSPCFATGTRIAVPAGEVAVDGLRIGDLVMTAAGTAKPVKWIGRRSYPAAAVAANRHVQPVLVRRDAIAPGMPHRDLMVSPLHALFIDGAFVPASALVNGVSVVRCDDLAAITYIHIETDAQDVVFAEGMPAETFVDDNSRLMFDNAHEYYELYGADDAATFSGTRLEEGVQLEAMRRRIAARAGAAPLPASTGALRGNVERIEDGVLHGWIAGTTASAPVEIDVLVDGELVARTIANRYRVDLDHAGIAGGCAGFTVALPASAESLAQVGIRRASDGARIGQKVAAQAG